MASASLHIFAFYLPLPLKDLLRCLKAQRTKTHDDPCSPGHALRMKTLDKALAFLSSGGHGTNLKLPSEKLLSYTLQTLKLLNEKLQELHTFFFSFFHIFLVPSFLFFFFFFTLTSVFRLLFLSFCSCCLCCVWDFLGGCCRCWW